jgi:3-(3-hydroxy-phenyl)propionate hydroxylase
LDRVGKGMTAILFCEAQTTREQTALLAQVGRIDRRFVPVLVTSGGSVSEAKTIADSDGEIARLFAAVPGTLYLLRPDLHIAGRWKAVIPGEILKTAGLCLGSETP